MRRPTIKFALSMGFLAAAMTLTATVAGGIADRFRSPAPPQGAEEQTVKHRAEAETAKTVTFYGVNATGSANVNKLIWDGEKIEANSIISAGHPSYASFGWSYNGAAYVKGTYYQPFCHSDFGNGYNWSLSYDLTSGNCVGIVMANGQPNFKPTTSVVDKRSGNVYACFQYTDGSYKLGSFPLNTAALSVTEIATLDQRLVAMAKVDAQVMAIGVDGKLYKVNTESGELTEVGSTGFTPSEAFQDAAWDRASNTLFWFAVNDTKSALMTVDTETGTATEVYDFGSATTTYAGIIAEWELKGQPNPVTNLQANFAEGSTDGTVTFTLPTEDTDGGDYTMTVNYTISVDDTEVVTLSEWAGENINYQLTLTPGTHTITVVVEVNGVKSDPATTTVTIAGAEPVEPAEPLDPVKFYAVNATGSADVKELNWNGVELTKTDLITAGSPNYAAFGWSYFGGAYVKGTYYQPFCSSTMGSGGGYKWALGYDLDLGNCVNIVMANNQPNFRPTTTAMDKRSGNVYGCFQFSDETYHLGSFPLNATMLTVTDIATLSQRLVAMAKVGEELMAIGVDGKLYKVNTTDGTLTEVGSTGFTPSATAFQDAAWDRDSNTLYWFAVSDTESVLMTVDTTTGQATRRHTFTEATTTYGGIICEWELKGKPEPVTNLTANFELGKTEGSITFTLPTKDVDGGEYSSLINYIITVDGANPITSKGWFGETMTYPLTLTTGNHTITVVAEVSGVQSDPVSITVNVGEVPGTPLPFYSDLATEAEFEQFSVVDANSDGVTWRLTDGKTRTRTNYISDADDWLISPMFYLETGKMYELWMVVVPNGNSATYAVSYGTEATAEGLSEAVTAERTIDGADYVQSWLTVAETGLYCIGIHDKTPAAHDGIYVTQFMLQSGVAVGAPEAGQILSITPGGNGELKATIEYKAPTKRFMSQDDLTTIDYVEVYNTTAGHLVEKVMTVTPGETITVTDAECAPGSNAYRITAYNENGPGRSVTDSGWLGEDVPGAPINVKWVKDGDNVVITWEPAPVGQHLGYVNPATLSYTLVNRITGETLATDLAETTYTDTPAKKSYQSPLDYGVTATNSAGTGFMGLSNYAPFGDTYPTPAVESFAGGEAQQPGWCSNFEEGVNGWDLYDRITSPTCEPQDGDAGMAVHVNKGFGVTRLDSPMFDLSTLANPTLTFWYAIFDMNAKLEIMSSTDNGNTWTLVEEVEPADNDRWNWAAVSLAPLKGEKEAMISFRITTPQLGYYCAIDNIAIVDRKGTDLQLNAVSFDAPAVEGQALSGKATVQNVGTTAVDAFTIDVEHAAVKTSFEGSALQPGETKSFSLSVDIPLGTTSAGVEIAVSIALEGDEDAANNRLTSTVRSEASRYPAPLNVTGSAVDDEVTITWEAPVAEYTAAITDDCEGLTSWSVGGICLGVTEGEIAGYKVVDNDQLFTYVYFSNWASVNPYLGMEMAAQVYDMGDLPGSPSTILGAHSGNKFFTFWASDFNEDYLILPELGSDKYLSFWAKAYTNRYGLEAFDIMVSTTGNDVEDFVVFTSVEDVDAGYVYAPEAGYTFYEFTLPDDTRYVAIRYRSENVAGLFIDDLTYTPASNAKPLERKGYDVYRDGIKVNAEPVEQTAFTEKVDADGTYEYRVAALYDLGTSGLSEAVTVQVAKSGLESLEGESTLTITGITGAISISGATGAVEVYDSEGRLMLRRDVDSQALIPMNAGIYMVRTPQGSQTVLVR